MIELFFGLLALIILPLAFKVLQVYLMVGYVFVRAGCTWLFDTENGHLSIAMVVGFGAMLFVWVEKFG